MSGKSARRRRREKVNAEKQPCSGRQVRCQAHRTQISEELIADIAGKVKLLRQNASDAVAIVRADPTMLTLSGFHRQRASDGLVVTVRPDLMQPRSLSAAALQRYVIAVGESAKAVDALNCMVLREIGPGVPWTEIKGIRDVLSHQIDPSAADPLKLLERIGSYLPFLAGMPAIIFYAQPAQKVGVVPLPSDFDLVNELHREWGIRARLKYLGFLSTGEPFSATAYSYDPRDAVEVVDTRTGEVVADATLGFTEIVKPGELLPWTHEEAEAAERDVSLIKRELVIMRDTPAAILCNQVLASRCGMISSTAMRN